MFLFEGSPTQATTADETKHTLQPRQQTHVTRKKVRN
jgi:hypothetical protein